MDPQNGIAASMASRGQRLREDWGRTFMPDGNVTEHLRYAVWVAVGDYGHPHVRTLLGWCTEYAELALRDPRWESGWNTGSKSLLRGNILAAGAIASAWLLDATLDAAKLREAAESIEHHAVESAHWSDPEQTQLVEASQLFLLSGDPERAQTALTRRKNFKRTQHYYDWYARVLALSRAGDAAARAAFDEQFATLRLASWSPPRSGSPGWFLSCDVTLLQLRLALLSHVVIDRQALAGRWREVLARLARPGPQ